MGQRMQSGAVTGETACGQTPRIGDDSSTSGREVRRMAVTAVEFIDYGVAGEYGFFGKVVAKTDVIGMTESEVEAEVAAMLVIVGDHCVAVKVETVGHA